jgi:hypothetical protein
MTSASVEFEQGEKGENYAVKKLLFEKCNEPIV